MCLFQNAVTFLGADLAIKNGGPHMNQHLSPFINSRKKTIEFHIQNDCASADFLVRSFNHWAKDVLVLRPGKKGIWKMKFQCYPKENTTTNSLLMIVCGLKTLTIHIASPME